MRTTLLICTLIVSLLASTECRRRIKRGDLNHQHSKDVENSEHNSKNSAGGLKSSEKETHEEISKDNEIKHSAEKNELKESSKVPENPVPVKDDSEHEKNNIAKEHHPVANHNTKHEAAKIFNPSNSLFNPFGSYFADKVPTSKFHSNIWNTDKSMKQVVAKPDMDIYFYDSISPPLVMHKPSQYAPNLFDSQSPATYKVKDDAPSSSYQQQDEDVLPDYYKWMQHRSSPIQRAFEIANMMVKVGLDDGSEGDDYGMGGLGSHHYYPLSNVRGSGFPIMKLEGINDDNNKVRMSKFDRSLEKNYYCPVHALQSDSIGMDMEGGVDMGASGIIPSAPAPQMVQVCSCRLMKKRTEP